MKSFVRPLCGGVIGLVFFVQAGPVRGADDYPIHVYAAPRAEPATIVDGELNDPVWRLAPAASGFYPYGTQTLAPIQTSFRVMYDDRYLYVGIRCEEPAVSSLVPLHFARDDMGVFGSEALEVFVDPGHTHDLYYQFALNVADSLYDSERQNPFWNSDTIVKGFIGGDFWSVEMAIPWKALDVVPEAGKTLGFNVARDRGLEGSRSYTTWCWLQGGFHDPVRFGHLVLSGTPALMEPLAGTFRAGGRTGPIVLDGAVGMSEADYLSRAAADVVKMREKIAEIETEQQRAGSTFFAAELGRRLEQYRKMAAELEASAMECRDSVRMTRQDIGMQKFLDQLRAGVGEARLAALLNEI